MKAPKRRRPLARRRGQPPVGVDLSRVADHASYVGSPEHKDTPSFAGWPRPRWGDAAMCDRSYARRQVELTEWLRVAIRAGQVSADWAGDFPRYVWALVDGDAYEARLVNEGQGSYKAYKLEAKERPEWL